MDQDGVASVAPDPHRWRGLVVISLAVAIIIADATVINVSIPSIIRDLKITTTDAEWITSVYSLVFAALLITVGRLGDIFGRRRLLLIGTRSGRWCSCWRAWRARSARTGPN
jgi:MFS family permease